MKGNLIKKLMKYNSIEKFLVEALHQAETLQGRYADTAKSIRAALSSLQDHREGPSNIPGHPTRFTDPGLDSLTPTEKRVLDEIRLGKSPKEIAHSVGRSVKTIEAQRDTIRKKLGYETARKLEEAVRI
jgi:DNA-binding NarL/FixJ family response regulator